jgi:hypothetical protein
MKFESPRVRATLVTCALLTAGTALAEDKLQLKDLPAAVQKTVQEETKNATLIGIEKETEQGRTVYEIETKRDGRARDLLVDTTGAIVEVEEEMSLANVPDAARAAIERLAAGGKVEKVESVTRGTTVDYEATINKSGKRTETTVTSAGVLKKK